MAAIFATTWVRAIVVAAIVLARRWATHHVLAVVHKVVVLAFHGSAFGFIGRKFLESWLASIILLLVELHRIAIGSVVLPCHVFIHILALGDRPPVVI